MLEVWAFGDDDGEGATDGAGESTFTVTAAEADCPVWEFLAV